MSDKKLNAHYERVQSSSLEHLASARLDTSFQVADWTVNVARQFLDPLTEDALTDLAEEREITSTLSALFAADIVNPSEGRPAMHWALRAEPSSDETIEAVRTTLEPALAFAERVRAEKKFDTIIHLGIGGSDFGPRLLFDARKDDDPVAFDIRFAANVDPLDLDRALAGLDPQRTLVIGVSKSFSSEETLYNLERVRAWMRDAMGDASTANIALVTAAPDKAKQWLGTDNQQIFEMPLSVGGRFSLWSNASLVCMIAFGRDWFEAFLEGAREVDTHVRSTPLRENAAVRLALIDYWNVSVRDIEANICLAYSNALRMLPAYLQQLQLESNGKTVRPDGTPAKDRTIASLWGGEGTIGQHSYHQWLHQGSAHVSAEFIVAINAARDPAGSRALIAHALAQAEVLANGLSAEQIARDEPNLPDVIVQQKVMPGGRPSVMLACLDFNVRSLGALIALYEHRTYVAGRLWQINSFDQWGVERGKVQAAKIKSALAGDAEADDPVTRELVKQFRR